MDTSGSDSFAEISGVVLQMGSIMESCSEFQIKLPRSESTASISQLCGYFVVRVWTEALAL